MGELKARQTLVPEARNGSTFGEPPTMAAGEREERTHRWRLIPPVFSTWRGAKD